MTTWYAITRSAEQTQELAEFLARRCADGEVLALLGDLAAGKTAFTKGLARGLGIPGWRYVQSPTFVIQTCHHGERSLGHIDLYRLESPDSVAELALEDSFPEDGLVAIEWAERAPDLWGALPGLTLLFSAPRDGSDTRLIAITPRNLTDSEALARLEGAPHLVPPGSPHPFQKGAFLP